MTDKRLCMIYARDGEPVREDFTFAEAMAPDESGYPRLISLLSYLDEHQIPFTLCPSREIFPADFEPRVNL